LIATLQLSELILNAIALDVVLNFDAMVFRTLVPVACVGLVEETAPLRIKRPTGILQTVSPYMKFLVIGGCVAVMSQMNLRTAVDNMRDSEKIMCGGSQNFLAAPMSIGPVIAGIPEVGQIAEDYTYRAILQRTGLENSGNDLYYEGGVFDISYKITTGPDGSKAKFLYSQRPVDTLSAWRDRSIEDWALVSPIDYTGQFSACQDTWFIYQQVLAGSSWEYSNFLQATWHAIRSVLDEPRNYPIWTYTHCSAVRIDLCSDPTDKGKTVRFWCPKTCQANDLSLGLVQAVPVHGVPDLCVASDQAKASRDQDCTEPPLLDMIQSAAFAKYTQGLFTGIYPAQLFTAGGNRTLVTEQQQTWTYQMQQTGCDFFKNPAVLSSAVTGSSFQITFCNSEDDQLVQLGLSSARALCPITCGCNSTIRQLAIVSGKTWTPASQCPLKCFLYPHLR
jgi:hypothetical protein